jgi:hypothetical protein
MLAYVWPFLIYWLVLFVACYIVVEYAQKYLYDETTPLVGLKVLLGSAILAGLLVKTRSQYDTMFTSDLGWTVIQAIVWFAVFVLVFRFHPQHGAAIGVATMLIVAGLATMGVESLLHPRPVETGPAELRTNKPLRRAIGPPPVAPAKETAKEKETAKVKEAPAAKGP